MKRIIMHWTGGKNTVSNEDREHYHAITGGDGETVMGYLKPEQNTNTKPPYAAHTRGLNSGSIGMAIAGMWGAKDRPLEHGDYPMTWSQLHAFADAVAEMALTYKIPITRKTVLTHAEVQPTLGVWQRGKWDICVLPGGKEVRDPVEAGDALRGLIKEKQAAMGPKSLTVRLREKLARA